MNPDLEKLVGRAVIDQEFRDKLLADPERAATDAGFNLSGEELDNLKKGVERVKSNYSSQQLDQQFGSGQLLAWA